MDRSQLGYSVSGWWFRRGVDGRVRGMRRSGGCDGGDKANKGEFWCGWIAGVRSAESDAASPGARGFCLTNELAEGRKNNNKWWQ